MQRRDVPHDKLFFPDKPKPSSDRMLSALKKKKDGRQLLVACTAIVVFFASVWRSNTARNNCLTKTDGEGSAAKTHTAKTSVGYESNAGRPFPPLWIPFLICVYSKENKCEGNTTSHRPQEEEKNHLHRVHSGIVLEIWMPQAKIETKPTRCTVCSCPHLIWFTTTPIKSQSTITA